MGKREVKSFPWICTVSLPREPLSPGEPGPQVPAQRVWSFRVPVTGSCRVGPAQGGFAGTQDHQVEVSWPWPASLLWELCPLMEKMLCLNRVQVPVDTTHPNPDRVSGKLTDAAGAPSLR